jgi:hypothetical protein
MAMDHKDQRHEHHRKEREQHKKEEHEQGRKPGEAPCRSTPRGWSSPAAR